MRLFVCAVRRHAVNAGYATPRTVDWLDLLPEEDYQAMLDMPEIGHAGSEDAPYRSGNKMRDDSLRVFGPSAADLDGQEISHLPDIRP
jgi:hypothetical protein